MAQQKPGVDPAVLRLAMWMGGGSLLVAASFMPVVLVAGVDLRLGVVGAATGLIGWATRAPGHISVTSHPDDL